MNTVHVYAVPGETYALVRGVGAGRWFRAQGIPALRSPVNNGYWLRAERVADVMALLERDFVIVRFSPHAAPRHVPEAADDMEVAA